MQTNHKSKEMVKALLVYFCYYNVEYTCPERQKDTTGFLLNDTIHLSKTVDRLLKAYIHVCIQILLPERTLYPILSCFNVIHNFNQVYSFHVFHSS